MKQLPPSLREKQRYLKFKIHADREMEIGEIVNFFWNECIRFMGTKDCSASNFWIIGNKFDEDNQEGVVRVNREKESELRAALATSQNILGQNGFVEITKASGSLKSLEE